ncbi:MAG: trypsin-like peptidase domain-containing protein [Anaerolineae bacterium]|nr:trypsin-like peptidase domain-containing protein [Anaerolineae bacterium]
MERKTRANWIWALAIVMLLAVALSPEWSGVATLDTSAALTSELPTAAVTLATEPYDEQQAANALEQQMIDVYDGTSPAVVNITNRSYVYYRFMGAVPEEGTGSGFVYDAEGHIVTNYHVIENAEELLVTLAGGEVYDATVVGSDPANDLAVIRIDAGADLPAPLTLGDSDGLRVGQFVVAIGNPYGLEQTMTTGVVSALGRVIEGAEDGSFIGEAIQTDAAINPGNSGGPLLDLQGHVVGVNSQIISPSGASSGIGFAVSASTVQRVVPELIARGYYGHPWLGVDTVDLTSLIAGMLRDAGIDVAADSGLLVLDVTGGGPADQAGVQGGSRWVRFGRYQIPVGGDIITAVDGEPTADLETLTVYLEMEKAIGDVVELTILRGDREITIPVVLGEQAQV